MNRWYRAYEGTVSDSKLHEAAMEASVSRSVVIATWHAILESCAVNESDHIKITPRRVSIILAEEIATIERVFQALEIQELITKSTVVHWHERQFSSDTSRQRTREYRERQKLSQETSQKRHSDSVVTSQKRHGDAPDTETETYTEKEGGNAQAREESPPLVEIVENSGQEFYSGFRLQEKPRQSVLKLSSIAGQEKTLEAWQRFLAAKGPKLNIPGVAVGELSLFFDQECQKQGAPKTRLVCVDCGKKFNVENTTMASCPCCGGKLEYRIIEFAKN